jgi:hypothetical protein
VVGDSASSGPSTYGVFGLLQSNAPGGSSAGVLGSSNSQNANGYGVWGRHLLGTGTSPGVYGNTNSSDANAVAITGEVVSTSPGAGATAVRAINNGTNGNGYGVWGSHAGSGIGVYGQSSGGVGVLGFSSSVGLFGFGTYGVLGAASGGGGRPATSSATCWSPAR